MSRHPKSNDSDRDEKSRVDARLDEALKETFPASDPSAKTGVFGIRADMPPRGKSTGKAARK